MPPKKELEKEAIVLAIDVGRSTLNTKDGVSFFMRAKECLSLILTRMILSESCNEVSLLLLGEESQSAGIIVSGFKKVTCKFKLQPVSWEILRFVETELKPTENASDWLDAFVISNEILGLSDLPRKKIVVISDFASPVSESKLSGIMKELEKQGIEIIIIGPEHFSDIIYERHEEPSMKRIKLDERSEIEKASAFIIKNMWDVLGSALQVCTFDLALRQLSVLPPQPVRPSAWKCLLKIGSIQISVSGHLKVKVRQNKRNQKAYDPSAVRSSGDSVPENITRGTEMTYVTVDPDGGETCAVPVKPDQIIQGHRYGSSVIPFGEADSEAFKYYPGEKGLTVIGFTKMETFNLGLLIGTDCRIIVPREDDPDAEVALSALIQALYETDCGAIARKVYAQDRGLALVLLTPLIDKEEDDEGNTVYKECLVMNDLPFKEGVKLVEFPSLKEELTEEQIKAVDDLIDSMDLMTADVGPGGVESEAFEVSTLREFKNQFYQHCIVKRALFPDQPLPSDVPPRLRESYTLPHSLREKNAECVRKIKSLFPITIAAEKAKYKKRIERNMVKAEDFIDAVPVSKVPITDFPKPEISEDDVIPVQNIKTLFQDHCYPPPKALVWEVMQSLTDALANKDQLFEALTSCLLSRRSFSVEVHPKEFNDWLRDLKSHSLDHKELYDYVLKSFAVNMGLITKSENKDSDVTAEDAKNFFREEDDNLEMQLMSQDLGFSFGAEADSLLKKDYCCLAVRAHNDGYTFPAPLDDQLSTGYEGKYRLLSAMIPSTSYEGIKGPQTFNSEMNY